MSSPRPETPDLLEVVYYSHPVPRHLAVLTALGLIFDRIHFPGVTMPPKDFDERLVADEIHRIASLPLQMDPNTRQLLDCMTFAAQLKYVSDFCIFPRELSDTKVLEEGVNDVVDQLELMVFGPRPEGQIAVQVAGPWIKGFPGAKGEEHFVFSAPDTITYPANALLYSARHGLPLINDLESIPVPGIPADAKANARLLATILTLESVRLVLPEIAPLEPQALRDLREELAPYVKPFRVAMLKVAKELNGLIGAGAPLTEVQRQGKFLVETDVYPRLAELDTVIKDPSRRWYRKAVEIAKIAPELALNFSSMPANLAIAKFLARATAILADFRDSQISQQDQLARSGLHYLLKLKKSAQKA